MLRGQHEYRGTPRIQGYTHISRVDTPRKRILRHSRGARARIRARTPSAPNRGVKNLPNRGGLVEVGRATTRHAVLRLEISDTGHMLGQDVGRIGVSGNEVEPDEAAADGVFGVEVSPFV